MKNSFLNKACLSLIIVLNFSCKAVAQNGKSEAKKSKPNILWIITDEHNFRTLGCYRDQLTKEQAFQWGPEAFAETPNIDALAKNGVLFNRMYNSAPVCTASRASMITGMYPMTLGIPNNSNGRGDGKYLKPDVTTIADVLSENGYMTGYSGKWHLAESRVASGNKDHDEWWSPYPVGAPNDTYGFQDKRFMFNGGHDKWKGIDANGMPYRATSKSPELIGKGKYGQPIYKDGKTSNVKFTTDWLADRTIEFIGDNKKKPFFYVVSIPDPHTPDVVRAPYDKMYADREISLPDTYYEAIKNKENKSLPKWQKPDGKTNKPEKLKKDIRQYLGMVKCIDDNVGRIVQKLKDDGIFENTIIMFSSDHGDLLGEHGRLNKGTIHEGSSKIPFILAQGSDSENPLIPRGKVINKVANNTDWMPTFLSLLNIKSPKVAGRDISPLFDGNTPKDWNDITFVRLGFYAAVTERYKLVIGHNDEPWLLDIEKDPTERINFFNDPKYTEVKKRLAKELYNYGEISGDKNQKIIKQLDKI